MKARTESIGRRDFLLSAAASGTVLTVFSVRRSTSLNASVPPPVRSPDALSDEAVERLRELTRRYGAEFGALGKEDC